MTHLSLSHCSKVAAATLRCMLVFACVVTGSAQAVHLAREPRARELIVKFAPNAEVTDTARALRNTESRKPLIQFGGRQSRNGNAGEISRLRLADGVAIGSELARLAQNPAVEYVEPNYPLQLFDARPAVIPNDFEFSRMYALRNLGENGATLNADVRASEAWAFTTGSKNVVVAVIDTGVDYFHEDLRGNLWRNTGEVPGNGVDDDGNGFVDDVFGYDFVSGDSDPFDDNNHGTHVAGTIGAVGNNGKGTVGVAWNAAMMTLKAFDQNGGGTVADAIAAIRYAVENGAQIINASWGLEEKSRALEDAVKHATDAGALVVAAAGNNRTDRLSYPAAFDDVVAVAATDEKDGRAPFSNFGSWVDVSAPGANILSTLPENRYGAESGTSMAAPHVSGVAALVLSRFPTYTREELQDVLVNSVDRIAADNPIGNGRINAAMAVQMNEPLPKAVLSLPAIVAGRIQLPGGAFGRSFAGYALHARAGTTPEGTNWVKLISSTLTVTNGTLGEFDSKLMPDGPVMVELSVTNRNGHVARVRRTARVLNTSINSPLSNDVLPPVRHPIRGTVYGTNSTYQLFYGAGLKPAAWIVLATGHGGALVNDVLAEWDTSGLESGFYALRLVVSNSVRVSEFTAPAICVESRLRSGFPVHLGLDAEFSSSEWRYMRVADLDGDGKTEFVIVDGGTRFKPQQLLVLSHEGKILWSRELGYDIPPDLPAIGDDVTDGKLEIFVDTSDGVAGFRHDGSAMANWPIKTKADNHAKTLADLDNDGTLELITYSQEYFARQVQELRVLSVYRMDGTEVRQWELPWCGFTNEVHKIYPAIANLDSDPELEIVVPSGCGQVAAYTHLSAQPKWVANTASAFLSSPVIGDLDGDGSREVMIAGTPENGAREGGIFVFDGGGQLWPGWPALEDHAFYTSPALGDLDRDGKLEIVVPSSKPAALHAVQWDGFELDGWPLQVFSRSSPKAGVAIGDVDSDGNPEVIMTSPSTMSLALLDNDASYVHGVSAWNYKGERVRFGQPGSSFQTIWFEGAGNDRWFKCAPPVLGDFDRDGRFDIAASSIQDRTYGTYARYKSRSSFYAWELERRAPHEFDWPMFNQNLENRGAYVLPLFAPPGPTNITLAIRDRLICSEDKSLEFDPRGNDLSAIAAPLAITQFSQPLNGIVSASATGGLQYMPGTNFTGLDEFAYTVTDALGVSSAGRVLLRVKAINDRPTAENLDVSVKRNGSVNIVYSGHDDEGDALTYRISTPQKHGELWNYPALGVYYPAKGFVGEDSFTYIASDGFRDSTPARVRITVLDTNNAPTIRDQQLLTKRNRPVKIVPEGKDNDDDPLTFEITRAPLRGQVTTDGGQFVYTPEENYVGSDSLHIRAHDGFEFSAEARIAIEVIVTNTAPIARNSSIQLQPNTPATVVLSGSDPDGDAVSFEVRSEPLHGRMTGEGANYVYTPDPDYQGPDRISFRVSDGVLTSEPASVEIRVSRENRPPTAADSSVAVPKDTSLAVPLRLSDADGDLLETIVLKGPAKGIVFGSGTNLTYMPAVGATGLDSFTYKAWDGQRFGNVATVHIQIQTGGETAETRLQVFDLQAEFVELIVISPDRTAFVIETTTDLQNWHSISEVIVPGSETVVFRDTNAPSGTRFYRALRVE